MQMVSRIRTNPHSRSIGWLPPGPELLPNQRSLVTLTEPHLAFGIPQGGQAVVLSSVGGGAEAPADTRPMTPGQ